MKIYHNLKDNSVSLKITNVELTDVMAQALLVMNKENFDILEDCIPKVINTLLKDYCQTKEVLDDLLEAEKAIGGPHLKRKLLYHRGNSRSKK